MARFPALVGDEANEARDDGKHEPSSPQIIAGVLGHHFTDSLHRDGDCLAVLACAQEWLDLGDDVAHPRVGEARLGARPSGDEHLPVANGQEEQHAVIALRVADGPAVVQLPGERRSLRLPAVLRQKVAANGVHDRDRHLRSHVAQRAALPPGERRRAVGDLLDDALDEVLIPRAHKVVGVAQPAVRYPGGAPARLWVLPRVGQRNGGPAAVGRDSRAHVGQRQC
mmetsp:Transcript_3041/g.8044  ORF Transcript_3041/g.8044 Transcript_3041/m.8044 type:complete len:225 (+) Transcript_3041:364-1038(+)